MADMHGKTVLITGANQGIGKVSAIELGKMGAKLILVCRNAEKAKAAVADIQRAGAKDVDLLIGDMGSQADIRRIAAEVLARHDRLDVLLNNAGVLVTSRRETVDGIEETLAINHLGYFLLTNLLTDLLKKSAPARVVSVSSRAHRGAKVSWDDIQLKKGWGSMRAYSQSKLALMMVTFTFAKRLAGTGVVANVVHPGMVATGLVRTGGVIGLVWRCLAVTALTEERGADTPLYAALAPELATASGVYFKNRRPAPPNRRALDPVLQGRVWRATEGLAVLRDGAGEG